MPHHTSVRETLSEKILDGIEAVLSEARSARTPLEVDPPRGRLFELFVTAEGAGYLEEEAEPDLTAETLCRLLAVRWGLDDAARESFQQQEKLPQDQLANMRQLWSLMRMWMEWTYAWNRWPEFHREP